LALSSVGFHRSNNPLGLAAAAIFTRELQVTAPDRLRSIGTQIDDAAHEFGRRVRTYAQFVMIVAETDDAGHHNADAIMEGTDFGPRSPKCLR
jgi:alkanesulfonate monooxygenase SsuD/methylene tetrahydromethanopterin reductase-like flavin-dependent oxidoreductase (luciferase family)